jgi:hypothetical protein
MVNILTIQSLLDDAISGGPSPQMSSGAILKQNCNTALLTVGHPFPLWGSALGLSVVVHTDQQALSYLPTWFDMGLTLRISGSQHLQGCTIRKAVCWCLLHETACDCCHSSMKQPCYDSILQMGKLRLRTI